MLIIRDYSKHFVSAHRRLKLISKTGCNESFESVPALIKPDLGDKILVISEYTTITQRKPNT